MLILLLSTLKKIIKTFLIIFTVDKQKILRLEKIKQLAQDNLCRKE